MQRIRKITKHDLKYLKSIIDSNELFESELLDEMTTDFFSGINTKDIWITLEYQIVPVAVAYCAPERMTMGTFNLYIAVHKDFQGRGFGTRLITYIEELIKNDGNRILIVETSGLSDFELTRNFYKKLNYQQEAVIREFYQEGEDKIIFWKKLDKNK